MIKNGWNFFYHPNPNLNRNAAYGYICVQQPTLRPLVMVRVRARVIALSTYVYNICFSAVPSGQHSIQSL